MTRKKSVKVAERNEPVLEKIRALRWFGQSDKRAYIVAFNETLTKAKACFSSPDPVDFYELNADVRREKELDQWIKEVYEQEKKLIPTDMEL